ncbi:MAG: phosphate starvation-inducible protein PhoH [Kordiimonas sp.]|nr:phosphate starvation-inducible protein PhoH [Kordiimonas sp.]
MIVEFKDNRLLSALYGEHNAHLARIEQMLDVLLEERGNVIAISGPVASCSLARDVLCDLYALLENGGGVHMAEVDAAIRMREAEMVPVSALSEHVSAAPVQVPVSHSSDEGIKPAELTIRTRKKDITPRSPNQARYIKALGRSEMVFGLGPAGTGKTFLAVAQAVSQLMGGHVDRIILSRPAVEAGERLGFLPGDMKEKVDPYLRPLYDAISYMMPWEQAEKRFERGEIEVAPLAFMRGRTLTNAFVILDEAQNTTPMQMKMFLTRLGEGSRMVIAGDGSQVDLPDGSPSGLHEAVNILSGVPGVDFIHFDEKDVVRHPLVGRIVAAYDRPERS